MWLDEIKGEVRSYGDIGAEGSNTDLYERTI